VILRRGINGVLAQLVNEGQLQEAALEGARAAAARRSSGTPWFVRVLIGAGAWVAASLLVLFLALAKVFDSTAALVIIGAGLYACGVGLRRSTNGDFAVQLSLAAGLGGAAMLVAGFGMAERGTDESAALIASLFVVSSLTVVVFADVVMRFLATSGACLALVLACHELQLGPDAAVAVIAVAGGLVWHFQPQLLQRPALRALHRPVAWGLVVSLLGFMMTTVNELANDFRVGPAASVSIGVALVVLVVAIAREKKAPLSAEPVLVALLSVALLSAVMLKAPGVLAGLFVASLAHHRRAPVMLGLALVFEVVFLTSYYVELELSLLVRALVLMASGALIFAVREYARRRFGPITPEELP
jgi:hypothetical protein